MYRTIRNVFSRYWQNEYIKKSGRILSRSVTDQIFTLKEIQAQSVMNTRMFLYVPYVDFKHMDDLIYRKKKYHVTKELYLPKKLISIVKRIVDNEVEKVWAKKNDQTTFEEK